MREWENNNDGNKQKIENDFEWANYTEADRQW